MHSLSIRNITKHPRFACATLLVLALLVFVSSVAHAQTTVFTYQGRLNDGGAAANGVFDMQFKLYDAADPSTSAQIGSTITNSNVAVTNGIFTVRLDFGASALPGANRFLEVGVRRISSDPYTVLAPRQQVTSAPYAIRSANSVVADQLSTACVGCVQDAQINAVAGSKVTGTLPASSIPAGNSNYIQSNPIAQQAGANFNISGSGTADTFNAATQYNIGGNRVFSIPGTFNTFAGVNAGLSNTTGSENAFFGRAAGKTNTTGFSNSFFGFVAGFSNTTGSENAFFGRDAGLFNTTGTANDFFGRSAGLANTTGGNNAFFGRAAGQANTTGSNNAFFGDTAGLNNTASGNSFFGNQAGLNNTSGEFNAFFGNNAGQSNTMGSENSFFGTPSGTNNTGSANSFFGSFAGEHNTTGFRNAFFGEQAGRLNTIGRDNSSFGDFAGRNTTSGSSNSFFGSGAGSSNTIEDNNTFIGDHANGAAGITNATAIGAGAQVTSSNTMVLGTGAVTVQVPGNLNLTGAGPTGGTFSANAVNAATQYNIGGNRVLSTTGTNNTFAGVNAGQSNTTGSSNAFFGTDAGQLNQSGASNAFFGGKAGSSNTAGNGNAFFGTNAGLRNTASNNSFFGTNAGLSNQTGSNNTYIGFNANVSTGNLTNATAIGANAVVAQSNALVLGNGANVGIGTPAPLAKLDVRGDVFVGLTVPPDTALGDNLYIGNTGGDLNNSFRLDGFSNNLYVVARSGTSSAAGAGIVFRTASAAGGETDRMIIDENGRVGIGTTTPQAKLDVVGNVVQDRGSNGLIKAMALIKDDNTVVRCYNSQATGAAVTTPPCNIVVTFENTGNYLIDFGFSMTGRYISLTPRTLTDGASAPIDVTAVVVGTNNQNQTRAYFRSPTAGAKSGFFIFVY